MIASSQTETLRTAGLKSRATELDTLLHGYRLCARSEGKSNKTVQITATALTALRDFFKAGGYSTDAAEIGTVDLREFILHLQHVRAFEHHPFTKQQTRGLSGHAINCYLRAIRAFWSWLVREELIASNPFARIQIPKPPNKIVATFSESQLAAMLKATNTATRNGLRDFTMVLMLLDTGLRASELTGLSLDDVDLDDGLLKVCGKGQKERVVPIGAKVQRSLWRYLHRSRVQPSNPTCTALFTTAAGRPITGDRLRSLIGKYSSKAGIEGVRCSPHTFRHTFAISYLRNGGDVFSLQRILGHSSLDVVRIYVNMAEADVKACHRRFSPADNMETGKARRT